MLPLIDGSGFDIATVTVAAAYASIRCLQNAGRRSWEFFASEISYGVIILPMFLLSLTFVSSSAVRMLMEGNKVIISLAGVFSLIVILKRTFEKPSPCHRAQRQFAMKSRPARRPARARTMTDQPPLRNSLSQ